EGKVQLKSGLEEVTGEVSEFFKQRLRGIFGDYGFSYDVVDAVLAAGYDDFSDALSRAKALAGFRKEPAFADLMTAFVRANNLSKNITSGDVNPGLATDESEKTLYSRILQAEQESRAALERRDYRSLLFSVAALQEPLDRFFNSVMVMVEDRDVRENRLALLYRVAVMVKKVADLSKLVVEAK
ncbi:MAG TPA: DALR anticodon-binding domain-containing protein, partial [Bacillota bacterium]|nr:DALR anticodon-binding domain-containing protein [Bacillota bacterium]